MLSLRAISSKDLDSKICSRKEFWSTPKGRPATTRAVFLFNLEFSFRFVFPRRFLFFSFSQEWFYGPFKTQVFKLSLCHSREKSFGASSCSRSNVVRCACAVLKRRRCRSWATTSTHTPGTPSSTPLELRSTSRKQGSAHRSRRWDQEEGEKGEERGR